MRAIPVLASALMIGSTAAPAFATPCAEHIDTIERRLRSPAVLAVTGETGEPAAEGSPKALPTPPASTPSTGDPGPSPQRIAAARVMIEKARDFERQGNQAACDDAMTQAKELLGPLP